MTSSLWSAGARSVESIGSVGAFSFRVPVGTVGAAVGLSTVDTTTSPSELSHGFMLASGQFYIIESGQQKTQAYSFTNEDVFSIARIGERILYCVGDGTPQPLRPGAPFALLGGVIYESLVPLTAGPAILDAALLYGGDKVIDAAILPLTGVDIKMTPIALSAWQGDGALVDVSFDWMQVVAGGVGGVTISFDPPSVSASTEDFGAVTVSFPDMGVSAGGGAPVLNGVSAYTSYLTLGADGPGMSVDCADILMAPLDAAASEDERSEAILSMDSLTLSVVAEGSPVPGPRWVVMLPGFAAVPAANDTVDVIDSAIAGETVYPSHYTMVIDGAVAGETVVAGATSINLLEDVTLAGEEVMLGTSVLLIDGAVAGDELLATSSAALLIDGAIAGDELLAQSTSTMMVIDGALAGDAALPYAFVDVEVVTLAGDAVLIASFELVEDGSIAGAELFAASLQGPALLEDGAVAGDELLAWSDSFALLQDGAIAGEQLFMKAPGLVAWVMNTDTGAVSWYDNWAFTSMAVVGGKVFAAGPDGLHILGGDLDGADAIDARVQFGYTELGGYDNTGHPKPSDQKKRLSGLWFGYHAGGELQATVETYGQGYGPHTYAMAARAADQPRNNRIVPGKGLNARYWRVGVANTDGCAFEVHSIAAEVAQSTRRI